MSVEWREDWSAEPVSGDGFIKPVKYNLRLRLCDVGKFDGLGIRYIVIVSLVNRQLLPVASSCGLIGIVLVSNDGSSNVSDGVAWRDSAAFPSS